MTSQIDTAALDPTDTGSIRPLDAAESAVWRAFVKALITVPRGLDADLTASQGLSLTEYGVLMHLSEQPDRRLRMSHLAALSGLSLSGMTRIISRLEADRLVTRERCDSDARGLFAVLSDAGFARLERAYPDHLASVRRRVIDQVSVLDLGTLASVLQQVADGGGADDVECPSSGPSV